MQIKFSLSKNEKSAKSKLPFRAPCRAISGRPRCVGVVERCEKMEGFVVSGKNDGRQQVAPDLTGLHQSTEQAVKLGDRSVNAGRVTVAECQSGEVGRLSAPQRSSHSSGGQRSGYQQRPGLVEVGGHVRQVDCVRGDDRPLGRQASDDGRAVETGDGSGRIQGGKRGDAERSTMIQRTLKRLHRRERRQPTHDRTAEKQQAFQRRGIGRAG